MRPDHDRRARPHLGDHPLDLVGEGAAVGVAEHERLCSRLLGRREDAERELGVAAVAVEEVLGVEEDPEAGRSQVRHRVAGHGDGLVERGPESLGDVQVRRLRDDADGLGTGVDEVAERLVLGGSRARAPRRPERDEGGAVQSQLLCGASEELLVLGVRSGPPTFDVGDSEMVELLCDAQLVLDRERHPLLLRAVPKGRVVDVDSDREPALR